MTVSSSTPDELNEVVVTLRQLDTHVGNVLLLNIFAGNGEHFADQAVQLFIEQPWRFESDLSTNPQWFAQKTIAAISDHCSQEQLEQLQTAILAYVSSWEKTQFGYEYHGLARFNLLAALPAELRSVQGNLAFRELERNFDKPDGEPESSRSGWVQAPIADENLSIMSDAALLAALSHFSGEAPTRQQRDFLKGGSIELARAVAQMADKEPYRFAKLALQIPAHSDPVYLNELLGVFEKAPIDDSIKLDICTKAYREHRESCGRKIADVLGAIEDRVPDDALEQLSWLATESSDPDEEFRMKEPSSSGGKFTGVILILKGSTQLGDARHLRSVNSFFGIPSIWGAFDQRWRGL